MKRVAIMQKPSPVRDLLELYLTGRADVEIVIKDKISDCQGLLKSTPRFNLLFIGDQLELDAEVSAFVADLRSYLSEGQVSLIGTNKGLAKSNESMCYIPPMCPPEKIIEQFEELLSKSGERVLEDHIAVPLSCLEYLLIAPSDLYLMIKQGTSKTFVKRFTKEDALEQDVIEAYKQKKLGHCYIKATDQEVFMTALRNRVKELSRSNIGLVDKVEAMKSAFEYANYVLNDLGIKDTKAMEVVNDVLLSVAGSVNDLSSNKRKLIEDALQSKDAFYYKHVSLTSVLAGMMYLESDWKLNSGLEKIAQAAFFHNLLVDQYDEMRVLANDTMNASPKSEKIKNHAKDAAKMVQGLGIPFDVATLIIEHHGSRIGEGFPDPKMNSNKLSELFMVATEFAVVLLEEYENSTEEVDLSKLLKLQLTRYGQGKQKILEILQNCLTGFDLKKTS